MEKPWKVVVAFLGVFIAGAIFGGFFSIGMGSRWLSVERSDAAGTAAATPAAATPNGARAQAPHRPLLQAPANWQTPMLLRRYAERLDLTAEQKERIAPVFQRATEDYRRVQQTSFRETAILLQRLAQDISKELTPEQNKKLEVLVERQRETMRKIEQQREQRKGSNGRKQAPGGHGGTKALNGTGAASSSAAPEAANDPGTTGSAKPEADAPAEPKSGEK